MPDQGPRKPKQDSDRRTSAKGEPSAAPSNRGKSSGGAMRAAMAVKVRGVGNGEFELFHPRCALERGADVDEVRDMIAGGETEIAREELLWLLGGCPDMIEAHCLLGELALADGDIKLARGHFGTAFQIGAKACRDMQGALPYRLAANQPLHESGKGLVWCLVELGKRDLAAEVADRLVALDPTDPLGVRALLAPAAPNDLVMLQVQAPPPARAD